MPEIRLVIADDHAVLREGLRAVFDGTDDITVVGEAEDGLKAVDLAHRLAPDVILMDIAMPGLGGIEATNRIRKECPDVKVLVLTQYNDKEYVVRFLRTGASGYILKTSPARDVVAAVRLVNSDGLYLGTANATELLAEALEGKDTTVTGSYESLTDREKEILKLIVDGMTSRQIADALSLSIKTIVTHRGNIMEKLGIHNKSHLIRFGIRHGIILLEDETR